MSKTPTFLPSTVDALKQASNSGTDARPSSGCRDCVKTGLAILPVVPSPIPNALKNANAELTQLDNRYVASDLSSHWFALRVLPAGYLYVLKPDLSWDLYMVDAEGLLRMTSPAGAPLHASDTPSMSAACKRSGDNLPAQVIAIDPEKHATVWIAFSRFRWTPQVMADYAANKEGRRDQRMTKLDVMAAAAGSLGSNSKAANAVKFGVPMSASVGQVVADYTGQPTRDLLNKNLTTPLRNRGDQGAALALKMAEISKNTGGKTGAVICLADDLGVTMDLNALRNLETGRLNAYMAANLRKKFVGEVIQGFEETYKQNGQASEWTSRYQKHFNANQVKADQQSYKTTTEPWDKRITAMSADVAKLNGGAPLKAYWRDFDAADDQSAKDRQLATAACIHGAVKNKSEQALWDRWFQEDPTDPYATLWGALTGMDADLSAFLVGKQLPDAGKTDKFVDIAKNIREAVRKHREHLQQRAAHEALALIGVTMASQVARLKVVNPALYRVAGARVLIIASVRTTVTVAPGFMSLTQTQEAMLLAEAAFGPPQPGIKRLLDAEVKAGKRTFVVGSNGVDAYAFEARTTTTQKVRVVELWLPEQVASELRALPAPSARLALAAPKVNPFAAVVKFTKTLPGVFAWVGLTLQALNLANSGKDLLDSKVSDKSDAYFGIASGILGVSGVMAEVTAGAMEKMGVRFAASAVARVALLGGTLAALSAVAESIQAAYRAKQAFAAEDTDAGFRYGGASVSLLVSGAAGLGATLAIASGAGALVGGLGFMAGIGGAAATIPVAGWIAAAIIFLGIGLTLLWKAIKATDAPLEVWLRGSVYGVGSVHFDEKIEMERLNDIMFAMSIEVEWKDDAWEWRNTNFYDDYDNFSFSITLPGAGAESVIDCKITLIGKNGRQEVFRESIRPRMINSKVTDPHLVLVGPASPIRASKMPSFVWWEPPRISQDGTRYGGQLKLDDELYSNAEVEIHYWPDQLTMPNFVLPKAIEQRTLVAPD